MWEVTGGNGEDKVKAQNGPKQWGTCFSEGGTR